MKSYFKQNLISQLCEGGQPKVFRAKFHGKDVAIKFISFNKNKDGHNGCHEFFEQEKFSELKLPKFYMTLNEQKGEKYPTFSS